MIDRGMSFSNGLGLDLEVGERVEMGNCFVYVR